MLQVSKDGGPAKYRTYISPLPSLRNYIKKQVKGGVASATAIISSARKVKTASPTLPGYNDYPMAAKLFSLPGAPDDDVPLDSARSGQSTFRQNSARWRSTPRPTIDNSE